MSSSPDKRRNDIALVVTIVAGLLIGFLIKKVHIGLLIGIGLGLMTSIMLKRRSK